MFKTEEPETAHAELSKEAVLEQLNLLVHDPVFRTSKRSIQFLSYVVEQTLSGSADQIKERTIGVEVFGREPSYDTNADHIVRTAAIELRKRLAIYYGEERHRSELRMSLVPGSYIPQFSLPLPVTEVESRTESLPHTDKGISPETQAALALEHHPAELAAKPHKQHYWAWAGAAAVLLVLVTLGVRWMQPRSALDRFWSPVFDTPGSVLLAVGDVPNGPPTLSVPEAGQDSIPIVRKRSSSAVPFADTVTIARVNSLLDARGKRVMIRPEHSSSFADLREGPVVLVGAFNNEWSLRLTRQLRYTLALDGDKHLIYIKDAKNPAARTWSWATDRPTDHQGSAGGPILQDYALISRIWNSETGHVVIVIGGLYTYGTEAAGEFLTDPQMMQAIKNAAPLDNAHSNLQIVLGTTVTEDAAGPPKVLALSSE